MDNIADVITNALKEFLDKNERRATTQQTVQESHATLLNDLQVRLTSLENKCQELSASNVSLESKCQELNNENANLKVQVQLYKGREEELTEHVNKAKKDIEKLNKHVNDEFEKFILLSHASVERIKSLVSSRDDMEQRLKEIQENQNEIAKQVRRHHQQMASTTYRTPVRSPSASSFLNGNNHGSMPRSRLSGAYPQNMYLDTTDVNDGISELSDHVESLKSKLDMVNDLQRSFEKSSFYSDE